MASVQVSRFKICKDCGLNALENNLVVSRY